MAVASLIGMVSVPLAGYISDRVGRVPVYRFGAIVLLVLAFPGWYLISLGNPVLVIVVIAVAIGFGVNTMLGAQCALLPEMFGNKHRYLGVAISREFSAVIAGGLAGVLGAILIKTFDGSWVPLAIYAFILAAITLATTFVTPETVARDLTQLDDAARSEKTRTVGFMRIARIAHPGGVGFAVVEDDRYRLIENPFGTGPHDLRPRPGAPLAADQVRLLAPVEPRTVVGMAHNTGPADRDLPPEAFLKPARSVIGPGDPIQVPSDIGRVDAEAELCAVIGADGQVFGWTLANDVTARDLQRTDARWAQAKGYATFTPCGPWIETELDPETVDVELVLDNSPLGSATNAGLARSVREVLHYLGTFLPLGAQDLVLLGAPGPYGPLTTGTTVTVRSRQLGSLTNPVRTADRTNLER